MNLLREGERLEDLQRSNLKIIQRSDTYCFTTDAVLLAHFVKLTRAEARVVDLGTGSGVLPLLLSSLYPGATFVGIEVQEELADMARRSVQINMLEQRIKIVEGDIRRVTDFIKPNSADAVVVNPPYIPKNAGLTSPKKSIAVAKQEIMCNLEDVFRASNRILKGRGSLFMIHRPQRLVDICHYARRYHLEPKIMRFVFPQIGREANMVLLECDKNSQPGMKVLDPLVVLDEKGNYTPEVSKMYQGEE